MKRILGLFLVFFLLATSCQKDGKVPVKQEEVKETKLEEDLSILAKIIEIDEKEKMIFVHGLGEKNPLGDLAYVSLAGADIIKEDGKIEIEDLKVGDRVDLKVDGIAESYPSQTRALEVYLLGQAQEDISGPKEELGQVILEEGPDKISLKVEGMDLLLVKLVELDYQVDKNHLIDKEKVVEEWGLADGQAISWSAVYSEGIPNMKIQWVLANGDVGEHFLVYDGKEGKYQKKTIHYYSNGDEQEIIEEQVQSSRKVKLYYIFFDEREEYLLEEEHEVAQVDRIAEETLKALRDQKSMNPEAMNPLPAETVIRSLSLDKGILTVDFSKEIEKLYLGSSGEYLQVQAIVNTLTQFPTVDGVRFTIEGSRDLEAWLAHGGNIEGVFREDMTNVRK